MATYLKPKTLNHTTKESYKNISPGQSKSPMAKSLANGSSHAGWSTLFNSSFASCDLHLRQSQLVDSLMQQNLCKLAVSQTFDAQTILPVIPQVKGRSLRLTPFLLCHGYRPSMWRNVRCPLCSQLQTQITQKNCEKLLK